MNINQINNDFLKQNVSGEDTVINLTTKNDYNINLEQERIPIPEQKEIIEEKLMFEYKHISPFRLYYHMSGRLELFLMILATILTIGAGWSIALKSSLVGDAINNLASTVDSNKLDDNEYKKLMDSVEPKVNKNIRQFLIYGSIMFVLNFFGEFLWLYTGLRQIHNIKINYFALILKQEQGWFDENNAYEFATKVQAQLEGMESAVGERVGTLVLRIFEVIAGIIWGLKHHGN